MPVALAGSNKCKKSPKSLEVFGKDRKREAEDKLKFEAAVPNAERAEARRALARRASKAGPRIPHRGMIGGWSILQPRRGG